MGQEMQINSGFHSLRRVLDFTHLLYICALCITEFVSFRIMFTD